ncbi:hypothetical protein ABEW05_009235 [Botrytis cinerea]
MAESETESSSLFFNRDHDDYFFDGEELIPHFPYRAYHLNILGYSLPYGRFEQDKHLSPYFLYRLRDIFPELISMVYAHIIEEPSIDLAAETYIKGSSFIPDPVLLSRRLHGYPYSDEEGGGGPTTSYPIPITAFIFKKETKARYAPTEGLDTQAWKIQNSRGWEDHRNTQQILERSVFKNPLEGTYSQIVQFAYSLALHEDFQLGYNYPIWWSPGRKYSLLKGFLGWFWSHFGLYINTCNWNVYPKFFTATNLLRYHRLEHLTLRFSTKTINLKNGAMHMNMRQFMMSLSEKSCGATGCRGEICGEVGCGDRSWFPNLRNITYLNRNHHTEGTGETRCDSMRTSWSRRLIKHFQNVKLSKSIEVLFDVYRETEDKNSSDDDGEDDYDWDESLYKNYDPKDYYYDNDASDRPLLLHNRQLAVQDCIRRLLMPNSLLEGNTDDLAENLGLQELFADLGA